MGGGGGPAERAGLLGVLARTAALCLRMPRRAPPASTPAGGPLRAVFLSSYPPGHYGTVSRLTRWVPHLASRGIDVRVLCPSPEEEFAAYGRGDADADLRYLRTAVARRADHLREAAGADVVLVHRAILPFGPWQRPSLERRLVRVNPRVVYDFYDSIWVLRRTAHEGSRSALARWLNPPDAVESICRMARAVTVSGEFLAEFARPHNPDVRIVPMLLDPDEYPVRGARPSDPVVLGWMGNRWSVARLLSLAPALRELARRRRFRLRVVAPDRVEIPGVDVESLVHPWTEESEKADLASFDVGLLPLFDDERDRGKFPFKSLQYAASGIPMVSTPVAVDREVFREGEGALYARDGGEWADRLERLVDDVELRGRIGAGARKALEESYSFAAHADGFADLLREVALTGNPARAPGAGPAPAPRTSSTRRA